MTDTNDSVHPDPALPLKSEETKVPTNLPTAPEMSASAPKSFSVPVPSEPKALAAKTDEILERLAKLFSTTAGVGASLSTISYTLYILSYLELNAPTRSQIIEKLSSTIGRTPSTPAKPAGTVAVSRYAPYIGLVNDTRFALRLSGLLPMYLLSKSVMRNPSNDRVIRVLTQIKVASYVSFTLLENLWFLSAKGLLSPTLVNRLGGAMRLLTLSCRPWLLAIVCDLIRLVREAQLRKERAERGEKLNTQEIAVQEQIAKAEAFTALSYLPMAVHYAVEGGIGLNQGMVGLSGVFGGSANLAKLWAATKK